jgi:hypothetical protein
MRRRDLITLVDGTSAPGAIATRSRRMPTILIAAGLPLLVLCEGAFAQAARDDHFGDHIRHPRAIASFSVGPDQMLAYPADLRILPDQHTTFWPPAPGANGYLVFASSTKVGGPSGTVVLQTSDLKTFTYATKYKSPVMVPPTRFLTCRPGHNSAFDENYSAPGSVVQDPTRPPGHLIMLYEAENHCPSGIWQWQFYATVGFARSTDFGKTWPSPINSEYGGSDRHPVLKIATPEPAGHEASPIAMGDVSPTGFVDTNDRGEHYLYAVYIHVGPGADGYLRVARAKLDDDDIGSARPDRPVSFMKWYKGAFSQPGIGGRGQRGGARARMLRVPDPWPDQLQRSHRTISADLCMRVAAGTAWEFEGVSGSLVLFDGNESRSAELDHAANDRELAVCGQTGLRPQRHQRELLRWMVSIVHVAKPSGRSPRRDRAGVLPERV